MQSLLRLWCFIFLSFLYIHESCSQVYPTRQYTTADELANSNVYDLCHDSRGYLWVATERGVSRFDGFKFTNYLFKEGIGGSIVFALTQNDNGDLYAGTRYDGVYKFGNNFHSVFDNSISLPNEQLVITGNYLFSLKDAKYISVVDFTTNKLTRLQFPEMDIVPNFIFKNEEGKILIATNKGIYSSNGVDIATLAFKGCNYPVYSISKKNNIIYAGGEGLIYIIENDNITSISTDGGKVKRILADRYNSIWYATFPENKLFQLKNGINTDISSKLNISGFSINKIMEDIEGNIWLATYGKGIFCIHHLYCSNFTAYDGLTKEYVTSLETDKKGNLFIGTYDGLFYYNSIDIKPQKLFPGSLEFIRDLHYKNNNLYVNVAGVLNFKRENNVVVKNTEAGQFSSTYLLASASFITGQTIYYSRWDKKVWKATLDNNTVTNEEIIFYDSTAAWIRINKIFMDKENKLWLGTTHGLYILENNGDYKKIDTGFYKTNVTCFIYDNNNSILIGTDRGFAKYQNGKLKIFRDVKGKNIENITALEIDSKNRVWMGTLSGLFFMDNDSIVQFDTRNILLSDEINALEYDVKNNLLWIGTTYGMSRIKIDDFDITPVIKPSAIFKSVKTADSIYRELDIYNEVTLPYTAKNLTIRFSAIHFSSPGGVRFSYNLDDAGWEPTTGRQIEYASMPYGKHILKLKAIGEREVEGPVTKLFITIETPFWATAWFKILVGFLIAFSAYLILKWRFEALRKKQQERLELQSKIAEFRHQALAASMNPHFIFNALNSIQHFINSHNTEEATDYLGKFARLIRMMLDSGGKTFIPLNDEIERLSYYLELEGIRFGKKLTYKITIDEQLKDSPTEIPNMVIQPLVENALWHGLLPANRNGTLNITFSKVEKSLRVLVDDNGIGINESKKRKKGNHNSLGIQMIRERLELLRKLSGYQATITIHDKSEFNPPQEGTLVQVNLGSISNEF